MTATEPAKPRTVKRDRDEVFVEFTRSICPVCKVVVDAQVNLRGGKVYLRKRCRVHGVFEALVYGDARAYLESGRFNKPGTIPLTFQTEVKDGCPADCGLCPEHKQHACLGIIEVNTGCNLDCPICFADSGHVERAGVVGGGYSITLEQCARMLDVFVESEGEAEVVMFSGGEPTIHKHILDFIDLAQDRPINAVNLNTNGIRLACDRAFVAELGKRNSVRRGLVRVLRPGGRLGITDVTADPERLPEELTSLRAWIACVADARPLDGYAEILTAAGLRVSRTQRHDDAMRRMIDQIDARLALIRMTAKDRAEALGLDLDQAPRVLSVARRAASEGVLGYGLLIAEKA